jgi:hypothetical protein
VSPLRRTVRGILSLVAMSALGACSIFSNPDGSKVDVSSSTEAADLILGDTARITIDVVNVSGAIVRVGQTNCNGDFVFVNARGATFHPAEYMPCTLALTAPTELAPGDTWHMQAYTTGRAVPEGSQAAPITLSPGTYTIRPAVSVSEGSSSAVTARSTPARITFRDQASIRSQVKSRRP